MAMSTLTLTQIDEYCWLAEWTGDGPTFYVYVDAVLFTTTKATWCRVQCMSGEKSIYVTDDSEDVPSIVPATSTVRIQWERTSGTACTSYAIWHKYAADGSYSLVGEIRETGLWLYEWFSAPLEPGESNFKLIPMRNNTACADAWYYTVNVTTPPSRPSATLQTGTLPELTFA